MGKLRAATAVLAIAVAAVIAPIVVVTPNPSHAAGAMAVGACGAYGYAFDFVDARKAPPTALARCKGQSCSIVLTLKKTCAAFAIDATNVCGAHGYANARRLAVAQNAALKQCYQHGGKDCVIRAFVCDAKG
jgi:hypothetical protein